MGNDVAQLVKAHVHSAEIWICDLSNFSQFNFVVECVYFMPVKPMRPRK